MDPVCTPLVLFTSTLAATIVGVREGIETLFQRLTPSGPYVLALDSNFGHKAQPGYEHLLCTMRPRPRRRGDAPAGAHVHPPRRAQGDGTCFQSALQPIMRVQVDGVDPDKLYYVKHFPSAENGCLQVPGVLREDHLDGDAVIAAYVQWLTGELRTPISAVNPVVNLRNYRFDIRMRAGEVIALDALVAALLAPHALNSVLAPVDAPLVFVLSANIGGGDSNVKAVLRVGEARLTLKIFASGKVNALGGRERAPAAAARDALSRLFGARRAELIVTPLATDAELARQNTTAALQRAQTAAPPSADACVNERHSARPRGGRARVAASAALVAAAAAAASAAAGAGAGAAGGAAGGAGAAPDTPPRAPASPPIVENDAEFRDRVMRLLIELEII